LVATHETLVYLEEPEIHLHPEAQVQMAGILAEAAKRGVIVVAETHSSLLLRGIQTLVANGELDPKLVKLHWFRRSPATGSTQVESADLDQDGAFGEWPVDFDDVMLDAEKGYLDAVYGAGKE
jgi:predicted ATPase